jgi:Domain of unknown function (DUF4395)
MTLANWMRANLATQGYHLAEAERRALRVGLRFSTGLCLALSATAVALQSGPAFAALAAIGAVAGFSARHPFDHLWNGGVRHLVGAPPLPPSPPRRRHAFKVATVMMGTVALLFFVGAATAAIVVGVLVLAACTAVTLTNLCIPSVALSLIERRRARQVQPVT